MASKEIWKNWHKHGTVNLDSELRSMLHELLATIKQLEKMYGERSDLIIYAMIANWKNLDNLAIARGMQDLPHPYLPHP